MKLEEVKALFLLAEINATHFDEIANCYWPEAYVEMRQKYPWWLVTTDFGVIKLGWRKRVISIHWDRTQVRQVITLDDVTKDETMVHAWTYSKAVEYLATLEKAAWYLQKNA